MSSDLNKFIVQTYRKRAKRYDVTANLYYLFGYREWAYRRLAVNALNLNRGDTVVDIACGTGLNFYLYQEAIGPDGKIIGVDLTDAMLDQAQNRINRNGWNNVHLVHSDATTYPFPEQANGVISTYALSLMPDLEIVLERGVEALAPEGRMALLELQVPSYWPGWFTWVATALMKPFAVTDEWRKRKPWLTIRSTMANLLRDVHIDERYLGLTYIISGQRAN